MNEKIIESEGGRGETETERLYSGAYRVGANWMDV